MIGKQYPMIDHQSNLNTEEQAHRFLAEAMPGFYVPSLEQKRDLLAILGVSRRFTRAFDGIRVHKPSFADIRTAADFDLLEIKTTAKHLPGFPKGFFFGMTENEEMLLKVLENKYFLCFVSLHSSSTMFTVVGWAELKRLIRTKRIQYQVNF